MELRDPPKPAMSFFLHLSASNLSTAVLCTADCRSSDQRRTSSTTSNRAFVEAWWKFELDNLSHNEVGMGRPLGRRRPRRLLGYSHLPFGQPHRSRSLHGTTILFPSLILHRLVFSFLLSAILSLIMLLCDNLMIWYDS